MFQAQLASGHHWSKTTYRGTCSYRAAVDRIRTCAGMAQWISLRYLNERRECLYYCCYAQLYSPVVVANINTFKQIHYLQNLNSK